MGASTATCCASHGAAASQERRGPSARSVVSWPKSKPETGRWRSPHDTSYRPADDRMGCTQRGTTLPRGSNSELDRDPEGRHTR